MRFFVELSYNGTNYCGWQRQPNQITVQSTLENAFSTLLQKPIGIMGCGRTDTGVHAQQYFFHFDFNDDLPKKFTKRINKFLPPDIAIKRIFNVEKNAHTRFDAYHRSYEYHLVFDKNPFLIETAYFYPFAHQPDKEKMKLAAKLLLDYTNFFPFCKSNSDVKTMECNLLRSEWIENTTTGEMIYKVSANRFLRGMIRLIVGMCINVGLGKVTLEEVKKAMEEQTRLNRSWSVPPEGLFLCDIRYPFLDKK